MGAHRDQQPPGPARALRLLVRLLPGRFRDQFADELDTDLHADHAESARAGGRAHLAFWWRTTRGLLAVATFEHLRGLGFDARFVLRSLRRRPLFVAVAVSSLAIGMAATTTVLATASAIFWRPIPGVASTPRLVNVKPSTGGATDLGSYPGYRTLATLATGGGTLDSLAGFSGNMASVALEESSEPELVGTQVVTANYFATLGATPSRGRFFAAAEELEGRPLAVVSHWFWQHRLESPAALPELSINGQRHSIIGVGPPGFRGHFKGFRFDLYLPVGAGHVVGLPDLRDPAGRWVEMIGRLRPGTTPTEAGADFERRARLLRESNPRENANLEIAVERYTGVDADFRGGLILFLAALFAVSSCVLLVACLNVSSLTASRLVARGQELAIRRALGAPRSRLARLLLIESAAAAVLAAAFGLLLARWACRATAGVFATLDPRVALDVRLDLRAILATLLLAVVVTLSAGLAPALRARAASPANWSGSGQRVAPRQRWQRWLVVGQVALSFVVLTSAALFLQALRRANAIDPGFVAAGVLATSLDPDPAGRDAPTARTFFDALRARTAGIAGVDSFALTSRVPLGLGARFFANPLPVEVPGHPPPPGTDAWQIEHSLVSGGYLATLDIDLIEGRDFAEGDRAGATAVAIVNRTFAERYFAGAGALGRTFRRGDDVVTIVGVAADARYRTLDERPMPFVYLPFDQRAPRRGVLLVRASAPSHDQGTAIRRLVRELAPNLPAPRVAPLEEHLATALLPQRVGAAAAGVLGLLGLGLSALGLYGVLAQWVTARTREIGLRACLGASPRTLVTLVLRQGVAVAAIGIAAGVPLAMLVSPLLARFLYGLPPLAPWPHVLVACVLLSSASLAAGLPALRAARLDPLRALRQEG